MYTYSITLERFLYYPAETWEHRNCNVIEAIADAILQLWRSDKPALHDTLVQHASQYNWANNAQQTLAVYERM